MAIPQRIRAVVCHLHENGHKSTKISKVLKEKYSISFTARGIRKFLNRVNSAENQQTRSCKKRTGKVSDLHKQYINYAMTCNPSLTARELQAKILKVFDKTISVSRLKFYRKLLGWTSTRTAYCQLISDKNKKFRKQWALHMLKTKEDFSDVIFTDETTVEMCSSGNFSFYQAASSIQRDPSRAPKPKHSYKVHVWGGISYRGRTSICIFKGIMDSSTYQQILRDNLLPFVKEKFNDGYLLYQDNDSKHKSRSTTQWLKENGVLTMTVPASSPDINPIENVWGAMKDYLKNKEKPRSKEALVEGIRNFWKTLTPEKCGNYIDHIHKVLPIVVLNEGGASGY